MNLDIKAGSVPWSPTFHLSTISQTPSLWTHWQLHIEEDPKINFGSIYWAWFTAKSTFSEVLCVFHICLIMALLLKPSCQKPSYEWERAIAQTLALIRHLRVIRLNTAFTLHSAHSSCSALVQEMHCMHMHRVTQSVRLCLIPQAPFKSCVRVWRQTGTITLNMFLIAELQTSCLHRV